MSPSDASRPPFARAYPEDAALDGLVNAFERGDFGRVRREVPLLLRGAASLEIKHAARDLLARTRPDPRAAVFFVLTAALLAFLSGYWWWKTGDQP